MQMVMHILGVYDVNNVVCHSVFILTYSPTIDLDNN